MHLVISGNIGVGKTTLCHKLVDFIEERLGSEARTWKEPAEENPYIDDFYSDPHRWAMGMQFYLLNRSFAAHQNIEDWISETRGWAIQDRSIWENNIFARLLRGSEVLDERDWETYLLTLESYTQHLRKPDLFLYLEADPKTCLERIQQRGRDCEMTITLDYLQKLEAGYEEFMSNLPPEKVLRLEWTEFETAESVYERINSLELVYG